MGHIIQTIIILGVIIFVACNLVMTYYEAFTGESWKARVERKKAEGKR